MPHASQRVFVSGANPFTRNMVLCRQQQGTELVDDLPRCRDEAAKCLPWVAVDSDRIEDAIALGYRASEDRVDQVGA